MPIPAVAAAPDHDVARGGLVARAVRVLGEVRSARVGVELVGVPPNGRTPLQRRDQPVDELDALVVAVAAIGAVGVDVDPVSIKPGATRDQDRAIGRVAATALAGERQCVRDRIEHADARRTHS